MKKMNPRRRPATQADVEKAREEAFDLAVRTTWAILFTVMRDKQRWGKKRLRRLWGQIDDLADSVSRGYVSINDLFKELDRDGYVLQREETET